MYSKEKRNLVLTIDVEDNFAREELTSDADWFRYERQVVSNTEKAVNLLRELGADATFFVLGKVADRHPEVVSCIDQAGFQIGSHGYAHELVGRMSKQEFEDDVKRSLESIEQITNKQVKGYRARSFSITQQTMWALDILAKLGIEYDSSILDYRFARMTGHSATLPGPILDYPFVEYPVSTLRIARAAIPLAGGILFRVAPFSLYEQLLSRSESIQGNAMVYCHVWEFNQDQPPRKIGFLQSAAQSPWTFTTEKKIRRLADKYQLVSIGASMMPGAAPSMSDT